MKAATHYLIMGWAWVSAVMLVGAVGTIIAFLLIKGLPALDLQLIFDSSDPLSALLLQKQVFDGLLPAIAGTLVLVVTAVAIALPVGLGAGIYLAEYSHGNVKRLLSLLFDILAGTKIRLSDVSFYYHNHRILDRINASFPEFAITAIVGPSGQGKSTLLSVINRLWEEIPGASVQGRVEIRIDGRFQDINQRRFSADGLRRRVGMVFQDPNPLPMSIFKNVAFPLKLIGKKDKDKIDARVRSALEQAFLWDEVKAGSAGDHAPGADWPPLLLSGFQFNSRRPMKKLPPPRKFAKRRQLS